MNGDFVDNGQDYAQIVAPSSLEEGYQLEALVNGQVRTIVVPEGGVEMGETFVGAVLPLRQEGPLSHSIKEKRIEPPVGTWRSEICGCDHCFPSFCMALFCGPILLAQVMTRLHLNCCCAVGHSRRPPDSNTCILASALYVALVVFWIGYVIAAVVLFNECAADSYDNPQANVNPRTSFPKTYSPNYASCGTTPLGVVAVLGAIATIIYCRWCFLATVHTRTQIRMKYRIPEFCGFEDQYCTMFCTPCVLTQMAEQSNDYAAYPVDCGSCWNRTGQSAAAPPDTEAAIPVVVW